MYLFWLALKRDLLIACRYPAGWLNPLLFFLLVLMLFPLAITSEPRQLQLIGPGVIWISLLFANMLSIEHIFVPDFEDGTLEQTILQPSPFTTWVRGKLLAHWLVTAVPLLVASFALASFFFLNFHANSILLLSLVLGSPVLTSLAALGAALTLSLQNRSIILILLILPLYLPVLIFGAGAGNNAVLHAPVSAQLAFLAAFLTFTLTFAPLAIAAALKISLD